VGFYGKKNVCALQSESDRYRQIDRIVLCFASQSEMLLNTAVTHFKTYSHFFNM